METAKNILICPLEWGLGHAGRMIPVARSLMKMSQNVIIGCGEKQIPFFRNELPGTECIPFPGFRPKYSALLPQWLAILFQAPLLIGHVILEHYRLKRIIRQNNIDIVISDNRFGLWNKKVRTVYVTHQLRIPLPGFKGFPGFTGARLHRMIIRKYDYCFIPDMPGEINISGKLSHGVKLTENSRYIGILSRFTGYECSEIYAWTKTRHNTVILSGPEPQKSILKDRLAGLFAGEETLTVFLEGTPGFEKAQPGKGNIISINHLSTGEMMELIKSSEKIVTRSGYTTIMELISMGCSALLIPTPGQTEQEYLAGYLSEKGWFTSISQNKLTADTFNSFLKTDRKKKLVVENSELLEKALRELLSDQKKGKGSRR